MSTLTDEVTFNTYAVPASDRLPFRYDGILIAIGGSVVLWGGIGAAIWSVANIVF